MALSSAAPDIPQKIAVASRYYGPMYPGEEGMVTKILDIDGQILKTLPEGLGRCIDWSVDNKYFALAEREKVVVYNAQTYEVWKELVGHGDDVTVVKLFPRSDRLASGASDHTVRLWQLATQTCIHVFEGHTGYLRGIAINPQKGLLVSTALDRSMRVWSLAEKTCVSVHSVPDSITRLSFSPDGEMLVSGDFGHMLRSWDIDGQVKTTPAQSLIWVISPDGRLMAANTNPGKGEIEIWSTHDDRLVVNLGVDSHLNSLMASRDGPWFALLAGPTIYRINIVTQETSSLKLGLMGDGLQHPRWEGHILSLTGRGAVSSDGQRIYLQTTEYNGMVPFQQWYILDWVSQKITDVDQNNVPPVFSGLRPLQRYMQEPGWLIDRWRSERVCWLPPAFRGKDVNSCCLAVDGPTAKYFSVNGTQKITVLSVKNTGEGQGQGSDGWRTVYACIERVLGQGKQ
ncbi:hypothetical protein ONZ45_g19408 [Pleurotus djamor]|nr:hypothetical protein ONZ45_g19408 [Pleurotus djamor]